MRRGERRMARPCSAETIKSEEEAASTADKWRRLESKLRPPVQRLPTARTSNKNQIGAFAAQIATSGGGFGSQSVCGLGCG